ncbi:MAG: hypothetical protein IIU73_00800 [Selenomonadales bacterium]|nr:hypothetical protein [Selenomonadales bacterium]
MDTKNGDLAVGYGYSKHIHVPVPDVGEIRRMHLWQDKFIVIAGQNILTFRDGAWDTVHTYDEPITSDEWDLIEVKIGNTDFLLIANGQTQLVKWDGVNDAELFGTGEWLYEGTVESVEYNAVMATKAEYAEDGTSGTFTLTMPTFENMGAFVVPADMGNITTLKLVIGSNTYSMSYVPIWSAGDKAVFRILTTDTAEPVEDDYGIVTVTLSTALTEAQKTRALAVGVVIDGITRKVDEIDDTGRVVRFNKPATDDLNGKEAKVRGGLSNIPVNYVELYYNRLFSAGDKEHPSRLYWSQPPGDTRSVEDWSMDDVSDTTGGGHVDIGSTSGDPITGLCALSNQLLIFKRESIYRLLGDRPSNFRVVAVTRASDQMVNSSRTLSGDYPFWMTKAGMYYHNGQTSMLSPNARQIRDILEKADFSTCKAAENRDRLYFTCRMGNGACDDSIIIYDTQDRAYLLRNGFNVIDICSDDGKLYMINDKRFVYVWDESRTYDGDLINAYWKTPKTDLSAKTVTKALKTFYARGIGGVILIEWNVGGFVKSERYQMPENDMNIMRIPMQNEGRVFSFKLSNEAGSWFAVQGGVEVRFEMKEDG